ncbi:hypothetical protein [Aquimarina algiphila]|uniref:hypothetical protein n=1 Tax=Aquimarina algiphila TaxID=2047982 RepID=UPI00232FA435|nr:hypothetical protein [Aquimarina algiphila]
MEATIQLIILLLLIILLVDRFYPKKTNSKPFKKSLKQQKGNSIMGESKEALKQPEIKSEPSNLTEKETKKKVEKIIPTEALDAVFDSSSKTTDANEWELTEEEEELKTDFSTKTDQDFNTGISFEELQKITTLLNQKELTTDTLPIAMKIENTELLEILNKQIPQAQQHVSDLLNTHLTTHIPSKANEDWRDFDIGDFV